MTDTPNLNLPYLLAAQSQKHVTHNEALRTLDSVVQLSVLDRHLSAPPGAPVHGDRYIVGPSPTGAWSSQTNKIAAFQDGAWLFYGPKEGWVSWVSDENIQVIFDGAGWVAPSGGGGGGGVTDHGLLTGLTDDDHAQYHNNARGDARYTPINPTTLGVNATADSTNKLSVNSAASLFNHVGSGGHQIKINKSTNADTASFLFQTGFSGRAELGTTGDDDFHFKVSADGAVFTEAIVIDRTTGAVRLPQTDGDVQAFTTAGAFTWTKPAWAKANSIVEVLMLGGGGGGGSGRRGAASTVRCGGGGGGSAVFSTIKMQASALGATVAGNVGAGGSGGVAQAVDTTNGVAGVAGGISTFGTFRALGGNFGAGGSATAGAGGAALGQIGPNSLAALAGGAASTTGLLGAAGTAASQMTPGGGGAGGGVSAANAVSAGGGGGGVNSTFSSAFVVGGTSGPAGANGGAGGNAAFTFGAVVGAGGGGGGSSITAAGGTGGVGQAGSGGGGGGASLNGFASGAGGAGGPGWVVVITHS